MGHLRMVLAQADRHDQDLLYGGPNGATQDLSVCM